MRRRQAVWTLAAGIAAGSGCGYVGETLPPALNIPATVSDLAAVQRGDRLIIQFTVAELTRDLLPLKVGAIDLYLGHWREGTANLDEWAGAAAKLPVAELSPGPHRVEVPVAGRIGQDVVLAVRTANQRGRYSEWSQPVTVHLVEPLPAPVRFAAAADPEGVRLTWQYPETRPGLEFLVYRVPADGSAIQFAGTTKTPSWVDSQAEFGKTYTYQLEARQVLDKTVAESPLTSPVTITPEDRFAPAPPRGLAALAGLDSIELTWEANTEADFAAYRVYRRIAGSQWQRLAEIADSLNYSDRSVQRGQEYQYALTAVDQKGNESERSEPVAAKLP